MATGINVLPFPIYAAPYRIVFPILDADGDLVADAASDSPDTQYSIDCGSKTACANELIEIETDMRMYYLDLTTAEMTGDVVAVFSVYRDTGKAQLRMFGNYFAYGLVLLKCQDNGAGGDDIFGSDFVEDEEIFNDPSFLFEKDAFVFTDFRKRHHFLPCNIIFTAAW